MNTCSTVPGMTSGGPWRWAVLAVGMATMIAACAFQYGIPFLVPAFRESGLTLAQAGLMISAPVAGVLCSLVAWGVVTDRVGERRVLAIGLTLAAIVLGVASTVDSPLALGVLLAAGGASGSCVHVASGRLILSWFDAHERGLAMGLRQTAQPLGVAMAALTLPPLADRDVGHALVFLAACSLLAAGLVVAVIRDRDRPDLTSDDATGSPYGGGFLWRIHASSTLLVVPQFTVTAFAFEYLTHNRAWSAAAAGSLLAAAQVGGGAIRLAAGWWSDRVGTRLRPMRTLALTTALVLLALAAAALLDRPVSAALLAIAAVLTASTNGLAFTAVAERAGRSWAGRALGVQNTTQNLAAAATPPVVAVLVSSAGPASGYGMAFCVIAAFPVLAAVVVPVRGERPL